MNKKFELGVYSFGNTPLNPDGSYSNTSQAVRNLLEAVKLADEVGLDYFGFGEHHTQSMPISSPNAMIIAAATTTKSIKLGTAVNVLPTEDPIRLYQQLATAEIIAPNRIDIAVGRGSSDITFPIFDLNENEYDILFNSKFEMLLKINQNERIDWQGGHRKRPLKQHLVVPRPDTQIKIWLATGGSPNSIYRAVEHKTPLFLGILGHSPEYWANFAQTYREMWANASNPIHQDKIAIATHGFVAEKDNEAKRIYLQHEEKLFATAFTEMGRPVRKIYGRENDLKEGMVFAGSPENIAERIINLHQKIGHSRHILQADVGGMPHHLFLKHIELLGTKVLPIIREEIG